MEEFADMISLAETNGLSVEKYISPCPNKNNAWLAMESRLDLLRQDLQGVYHVVVSDDYGNGDYIADFDNKDEAVAFAADYETSRDECVFVRYNEIEHFDFDDCASYDFDLNERIE